MSERAPERPQAWRVQTWVCLLVILGCGVGVYFNRSDMFQRFDALKVKSDVYPLPSPEQTVALSLGYRSAMADLIYAHVLVSYGLHVQQRRRFEFVGEYLDTISALDPTFAEPYRYADTFLVLQGKMPRVEDYKRAREILERGMQALPYDSQLWLTAGQYIAYIAPPHLGDPELFSQWRLDGARVLARACELIGTNENLPYQCITAASLFSGAGEQEASERFLERVLAVSDDPEIQGMALAYLEHRLADGARQRVGGRVARLEQRHAKDLPYVNKNRYLVLGPPFDAAKCAGGSYQEREQLREGPECATDWDSWTVQAEERAAVEMVE